MYLCPAQNECQGCKVQVCVEMDWTLERAHGTGTLLSILSPLWSWTETPQSSVLNWGWLSDIPEFCTFDIRVVLEVCYLPFELVLFAIYLKGPFFILVLIQFNLILKYFKHVGKKKHLCSYYSESNSCLHHEIFVSDFVF